MAEFELLQKLGEYGILGVLVAFLAWYLTRRDGVHAEQVERMLTRFEADRAQWWGAYERQSALWRERAEESEVQLGQLARESAAAQRELSGVVERAVEIITERRKNGNRN